MNITLLRHPHTVFHDGGQVLRAIHDPDITPNGRRQLDNFIGMLPIGGKSQWDHVFSSNLKRALLPAREIAEAMNVGHTSYSFLNELGWDPEWEGADYYEIKAKIERWQKSDLFYDYQKGPGGATEHPSTHRLRVKTGWDCLMDDIGCPDDFCGLSRYDSILVVSHHLTISNIISHMLGIKGGQHPFDLGFMKSVTMERTTFGLWRVKV